jgi:hypothetical protein
MCRRVFYRYSAFTFVILRLSLSFCVYLCHPERSEGSFPGFKTRSFFAAADQNDKNQQTQKLRVSPRFIVW